jgi:hypothetical protein
MLLTSCRLQRRKPDSAPTVMLAGTEPWPGLKSGGNRKKVWTELVQFCL